MSRNILPSALTYLAGASTLRIAHLVKIELAESINGSTFSYVTDYLGDITWDGKVYEAGKIIKLGDVRQTQGFVNYKVKVDVAGEFQEELDKGLTDYSGNSYIGRTVEILRAYLDEAGNIIPFDSTTNGPMLYFKGEITNISIREDVTKGSSTVSWECSGAFEDFEMVNGRITDDKAHRALVSDGAGNEIPSNGVKREEYKWDTGFQHANRAVEATVKYTTTETRYKMSSSFFGLKSKMKEYEVLVNNEVDLNIFLSAKYLPVVYGVRKLEGIPIFVDVPSNNAKTLYVLYAFCEGEIESFLDIYIDDKPAICLDSQDDYNRICYGNQTNGDTLSAVPGIGSDTDRTTGTSHGDNFTITTEKGTLNITACHGTPNQGAETTMVNIANSYRFLTQIELNMGSEYWDANSKLLDTAYLMVKVPITEDQQEIPRISAVVSGKKVVTYDQNLTPTINQYTLNPVWHLLEYMTNTRYGGSIPISDIDLASFYKVANEYEQKDKGAVSSYDGSWVRFWRYIGWRYPDGVTAPGDIPQMQCNTMLAGGEPVASNIRGLLGQMDATLNILSHKYHLSLENDDSTIADIHISECKGSIPTKDNTTKSKWNSIQATIKDPAKLWENNQISFFNSIYKTEDNNVTKKGNIGFPHITNYYTARFWAERQLNKSRFSRDITLELPPKYIFLYPNANITFTYDRFSYSNKTFRIKSTTMKSDGGIQVVLQDYDSSIYQVTGQTDESTNQTPIVPIVNPPRNLVYLPIDSAPVVPSNPNVYGILYWDESLSPTVFQYQVADWIDGDSSFDIPSSQTVEIGGEDKIYIEIFDVIPNTQYTFRVRAVNHVGAVSRYVELTETILAGSNPNALEAPSNFRITNPGASGEWIGSSLYLAWDLPANTEGINNYMIEFRSMDNLTKYGEYAIGPGATSFEYTIVQNMADYAANNASAVSAYRELQPRIRSENVSASTTSDWVYLDDTNS